MQPALTIGAPPGSYPWYFGEGLVGRAGEILRGILPGKRPVVITSPVVAHLFGDRLLRSLGSDAALISFQDGETNKSFATAERLVGELLDLGAQRDSVIVAAGGGVVGDTAGFVASIYLRGVDLVHVPTTLLAQIDSSIGGKVAVNHPRGKNLVGSFHPPRAVIVDPQTLTTLPWREMKSGLFEALKGGVIGDPALFELIESQQDAIAACDARTIEVLVRSSVAIKAKIVTDDEREGGLRRLLNYGHTVAHGIEAALDYSGLTHGEAVAWGMIGANRLAMRRGILNEQVCRRIDDAILRCEPQRIGDIDPSVARAAISLDKKFAGGRRVMVLPREIGDPLIVDDVTADELNYALDAALDAAAKG